MVVPNPDLGYIPHCLQWYGQVANDTGGAPFAFVAVVEFPRTCRSHISVSVQWPEMLPTGKLGLGGRRHL